MRAPETNTHVACGRFKETFESISSWLRGSRATELRQHREMQTGAESSKKRERGRFSGERQRANSVPCGMVEGGSREKRGGWKKGNW